MKIRDFRLKTERNIPKLATEIAKDLGNLFIYNWWNFVRQNSNHVFKNQKISKLEHAHKDASGFKLRKNIVKRFIQTKNLYRKSFKPPIRSSYMLKAKKSESFLEKAKEVVDEATEEVVEKTKEVVENIAKKLTSKNKSSKKEIEDSQEKIEKDNKLAKLKAKAEKLAKEIKEDKTDLKIKIKPEDEGKYTLASIEDYLKSSIHLGTRAITPDMKPFVYKRRADSLAVFDTSRLDEKLVEGGEYLAQFTPEDIVLVCKRESGHKAAQLFSEVTGIKTFTKNYPAGILTNSNLDNFMERELMFICDPWTDKSALEDAKKIKIPVLAICDTNNYTLGVDKVIPGNNKSAKSLGFIFYILAKLYLEKRKIKKQIPPISEWIENWDNLVPPK